jgi:hypothetical protein
LIGLASPAGETNIVHTYSTTVTNYLFNTLLDDCAMGLAAFLRSVDTEKEVLGCLESLGVTPLNISGKAWEDFLPLSKQTRELPGIL